MKYVSARSPARYVRTYAVPPAPAATCGTCIASSVTATSLPVKTCVRQVRPASALTATAGRFVTGSSPGTHRCPPAGAVTSDVHRDWTLMPVGWAASGANRPVTGSNTATTQVGSASR